MFSRGKLQALYPYICSGLAIVPSSLTGSRETIHSKLMHFCSIKNLAIGGTYKRKFIQIGRQYNKT